MIPNGYWARTFTNGASSSVMKNEFFLLILEQSENILELAGSLVFLFGLLKFQVYWSFFSKSTLWSSR